MANPADSGTFEYWLTNRDFFDVVPPKSGTTGDFETWLTFLIWFDYVEAPSAGETLSIDIGLDEAAYQGTGVRILG